MTSSRTTAVVVFLLVLGSFIFGQAAQAVQWWPLVPCGLNQQPEGIQPDENGIIPDYTKPCNQCDLIRLVKNLIDFVFLVLAPILATLFFVWAGFLIITGGASPSRLSEGKRIFKQVMLGLLFLGLAWLGTNTLLKSFASEDISDNWWQITCQYVPPTPFPTVPITPTTGVPPAGGSEAARALIASGVNFSQNASCGGNNHAQQNIQDIAAGRMPSVCSPSCACQAGGANGNITVDPTILNGLTDLKRSGINFTVTSLTTGRHAADSAHYRGRAVDIVVQGGSSNWLQAVQFLNGKGGLAFCETEAGGRDASCTVPPTDHIHWQR